MKVLSVKQPHAWLICSGIKPIENRTWRLPDKMKGKRVLIHASMDKRIDRMPLDMVFDKNQIDELMKKYTENYLCKRLGPFGAIIGSVEIVDCVINHESIWAEKTPDTDYIVDKDDKEWLVKPIYNWVLSNPILFDKPILNVKGKLNFWTYPNILEESSGVNIEEQL